MSAAYDTVLASIIAEELKKTCVPPNGSLEDALKARVMQRLPELLAARWVAAEFGEQSLVSRSMEKMSLDAKGAFSNR